MTKSIADYGWINLVVIWSKKKNYCLLEHNTSDLRLIVAVVCSFVKIDIWTYTAQSSQTFNATFLWSPSMILWSPSMLLWSPSGYCDHLQCYCDHLPFRLMVITLLNIAKFRNFWTVYVKISATTAAPIHTTYVSFIYIQTSTHTHASFTQST